MKTTYTLQKLNGLVAKDMATLVQLKYEISPYLVTLFKEAIRDEKEKFKHHFSQTIAQFNNDTQVRQYITNNQQTLIGLAAQLVNYTEPQKINSKALTLDYSTLCQFLYSSIEELLTFVTRHFPKHASSDTWVPLNYRMIILHDIKNSKQLLESKLISLNVDERIIRFALQPFVDFSNTDMNDFTYRNVIYLKELRESLHALIFQRERFDSNLSDTIQWKLLEHNFNSIDYFKFWTEQIAHRLNECDEKHDKLDTLLLIKKEICQFQVKPHLMYDPSMKPLKDILSEWIELEINYLRSIPTPDNEAMAHAHTDVNFKVKIDLSVAQIAYFLKVLIEIEIIQNENIARLLNLFSGIIKTKRIESTSPGSFRNRYYAPEAGAKDAVRKVLTRMLAYIDSNPGIR